MSFRMPDGNNLFNEIGGGTSSSNPNNPLVFFDISMDSEPLGRMEFELYMDKVPVAAENFRSICAGDNKFGYTYEKTRFFRIVTEFMA